MKKKYLLLAALVGMSAGAMAQKEGGQLQVLWASACRPVLQYTYKLGNRRRVVLYVSAG